MAASIREKSPSFSRLLRSSRSSASGCHGVASEIADSLGNWYLSYALHLLNAHCKYQTTELPLRLTSFTDFGLRVLMRMAGTPDRPFTAAELAEEFRISRNHLAKVISSLSAAGYLETRRGGGGGAVLARRPEEILLGDVVAYLEADQALVECFLPGGAACTLTPHCRLKARLAAAEAAFIADLNRSSLADCIYPPVTV